MFKEIFSKKSKVLEEQIESAVQETPIEEMPEINMEYCTRSKIQMNRAYDEELYINGFAVKFPSEEYQQIPQTETVVFEYKKIDSSKYDSEIDIFEESKNDMENKFFDNNVQNNNDHTEDKNIQDEEQDITIDEKIDVVNNKHFESDLYRETDSDEIAQDNNGSYIKKVEEEVRKEINKAIKHSNVTYEDLNINLQIKEKKKHEESGRIDENTLSTNISPIDETLYAEETPEEDTFDNTIISEEIYTQNNKELFPQERKKEIIEDDIEFSDIDPINKISEKEETITEKIVENLNTDTEKETFTKDDVRSVNDNVKENEIENIQIIKNNEYNSEIDIFSSIKSRIKKENISNESIIQFCEAIMIDSRYEAYNSAIEMYKEDPEKAIAIYTNSKYKINSLVEFTYFYLVENEISYLYTKSEKMMTQNFKGLLSKKSIEDPNLIGIDWSSLLVAERQYIKKYILDIEVSMINKKLKNEGKMLFGFSIGDDAMLFFITSFESFGKIKEIGIDTFYIYDQEEINDSNGEVYLVTRKLENIKQLKEYDFLEKREDGNFYTLFLENNMLINDVKKEFLLRVV